MASKGVEMSNEPDRVTRVTEIPGWQRRLGGGEGDDDADADRDCDDVRLMVLVCESVMDCEDDFDCVVVDCWSQCS